jgi:hypothetical protein
MGPKSTDSPEFEAAKKCKSKLKNSLTITEPVDYFHETRKNVG